MFEFLAAPDVSNAAFAGLLQPLADALMGPIAKMLSICSLVGGGIEYMWCNKNLSDLTTENIFAVGIISAAPTIIYTLLQGYVAMIKLLPSP